MLEKIKNGVNPQGIKQNLFWKILERCGSQGITLIITVILARILQPSEFGIITLLMVFINLLQVFVDSGMGSALIQKKNADDIDYSTVLYFNIILCIVMYACMFFIAPFLANYFNNIALVNIIRVLSIVILISGVRNIQISMIAAKMEFKYLFYSTITASILSACIGISMAYDGYGVWSLTVQIVLNSLVSTFVLWRLMKWKPLFVFSIVRLKTLASYGGKIFLTSLINTFYDDISVLIIGKRYSTEQLAFYDQGRKYPQVIVSNLNTSIDSVLFPAMSHVQDNVSRLRKLARRSILLSTYIVFPIMIWIAICAKPLVVIFLTDKWMPSIKYIYLFCFFYSLYPINTANINIIKATGKSQILLRNEIIKKIFGIIILLLTFKFGVFCIALGLTISGCLNCIINARPVGKLIGYSFFDEISDLSSNFLISCIYCLFLFSFSFLNVSIFARLVLQTIFGCITYIYISKLFNNYAYNYYKNMVKSFIIKRNYHSKLD